MAGLKKQVRAKERRVEELIGQADSLQLQVLLPHHPVQVGEVTEENRELRERLGMEQRPALSSREEGKVERRVAGGQEERALVTVLQRELDRLEEERLQLKTENRRLAAACGARAARVGLEEADLRAVEEYREALRRRRQVGQEQGCHLSPTTFHPPPVTCHLTPVT